MKLNELPEELIKEILRRQSFKDTLKSKCVCRRWEAIISDPTFLQYRRQLRSQSSSNQRQSNPIRLLACSCQISANEHREITGKGLLYLSKSKGINRSTSLHRDSLRNLKLVIYDKKEVSDHVTVTSSSFLELVLLITYNVEPLYLHNPSTEEFFSLPRSPDWGRCSICTLGLGRVDSTNEYKVVRAFYNHHNKCSNFEVFTLGSDDHWRTIPYFHELADEPSAFADGGLYMLLSVPKRDKCMVRFDIEHEECMVISPPEGPFTSYISITSLSIREVNGSLCLTIHNSYRADIWLLKDYKQGIWALNNTIQFSSFLNFLVDELECPFFHPLSLDYGDGKLLLVSFLEMADEKKLFCYDPRTQNVKLLPIPHPDVHLTATFFTESFDSLF